MQSVRLMSTGDIDTITKLDVLAFTEYYRQKTVSGISVAPRTRQNILACLNLNPTGCFVVTEHETVGFIFTRRWGKVGWIGTFGVHPKFKGKRIGQQLLMIAVEHLKNAGCTTVGLETMPDSPYNIGLYTHFGFRPTFPTLALYKETGKLAKPVAYTLLSDLANGKAMFTVTEVSQAVWGELDYTPESANAKKCRWGETLLLGWPQTWAVAVIRTVSKREGTLEPISDVRFMAVRPEARDNFVQVLQAVGLHISESLTASICLSMRSIV